MIIRVFCPREALLLWLDSSVCTPVRFTSISTPASLFTLLSACLDFRSAFERLLLLFSRKIVWKELAICLHYKKVLLLREPLSLSPPSTSFCSEISLATSLNLLQLELFSASRRTQLKVIKLIWGWLLHL